MYSLLQLALYYLLPSVLSGWGTVYKCTLNNEEWNYLTQIKDFRRVRNQKKWFGTRRASLASLVSNYCGMQAYVTAWKLMWLHASLCNCIQTFVTTCKLMDLHESSWIWMQAYGMPWPWNLRDLCTNLYKLVQTCTNFYKLVQTCKTCTNLYNLV